MQARRRVFQDHLGFEAPFFVYLFLLTCGPICRMKKSPVNAIFVKYFSHAFIFINNRRFSVHFVDLFQQKEIPKFSLPGTIFFSGQPVWVYPIFNDIFPFGAPHQFCLHSPGNSYLPDRAGIVPLFPEYPD